MMRTMRLAADFSVDYALPAFALPVSFLFTTSPGMPLSRQLPLRRPRKRQIYAFLLTRNEPRHAS